ncbi:MAG: exodeoxyribonuclease III [Chloroflexota bacterium]|nr:exodeoxyribonuclease III [Chloroflexota bacterium]
MKITTWNVNGFRAILRKEALSWIPEVGSDILCFQETKLQLDQITEEQAALDGYRSVWHSAERKGYSGVATFYKPEPIKIETGIGIEEFDVEGRVIRSEYEDFYLYNIYFPNGGQENKRVPYKLSFYEKLLEICDRLHRDGKNIIITGDFNTAHNEIDLKNPKSNTKNTGFLPEEREWIDLYLEHGFVDAFRELHPEREEYTYWTYRFNARKNNAGWRLDYFLVSEKVMKFVEDVIIHGDIMGSDHCPVSLILKD